jgi:hypothetical protein
VYTVQQDPRNGISGLKISKKFGGNMPLDPLVMPPAPSEAKSLFVDLMTVQGS